MKNDRIGVKFSFDENTVTTMILLYDLSQYTLTSFSGIL